MFGFFKKKKNLRDSLAEFIILHYRRFADGKLSDEKIYEIVQTTMRAFKEASEAKAQIIPGNILLNISTFMVMYRSNSDDEKWLQHLKNEINHYLEYGIRDSYINGLSPLHEFI